MRVLVTGANGYIGRHVVTELLRRGHDTYVSDLTPPKTPQGEKYVSVDIFSENKDIYRELGAPDVLIHLAWIDGFVHDSDSHMKNLSKHITFLNDYIDGGGKSVAVAGTFREPGYWHGMVEDDTPCNPLSQYEVAKNALRQSMLLQKRSYTLYWFRPFSVFGDDVYSGSVFAKVLSAAKNGVKRFPFTSGKYRYDFVSVFDVAKMMVAAIEQTKVTGIINLCTGKSTPLGKQMEEYIKNNSLDITLEYGAFPDRPYDSPEIYGDASKINSILSNQ